jgi:hypothetical protein
LTERIAAAKTVDTAKAIDFDGFISDCNKAMLPVYAVTYVEIADLVHPQMEAARSAFDNGVAATEFVTQTGLDHGLKSIADMERVGGDPKGYNLAAGAISEYVGSKNSAGWQRREGARVVIALDDGYAALLPIQDKVTKEYGFQIAKHEGGILHEEGFAVVSEGTVTQQWAAHEIEAVVERFQHDNALKYMAY